MDTELKKPNLRRLAYSPHQNPFIGTSIVPTKRKKVASAIQDVPLLDARTGELCAASVIHQIEEIDTDHFVKIFAAGIAATYNLGAAARKTFTAILAVYERQPMRNGYADCVTLAWFDDMLSGQKVEISNQTFNRGMRELLEKQFLAPQMPNVYWVNPALFFKGDRVLFVNDYRRKGLQQRLDRKTLTVEATERTERD